MANADHRERDTNLAAMILAYQSAVRGKVKAPAEYAKVFHDHFRSAAETMLAEMAIHPLSF